MFLAVDIGGTKLAVGVGHPERFGTTGELDRFVKEPITRPGTPQTVLPRIQELASDLLGGEQPTAVGISIGGPLDHQRGVVVNFPHLPQWKEVPLCQLVSDMFNAPSRLDNDANLGALAEHRFGAGKGCRDMVYMTLSTGIGGGVIVNGGLLHGVGSSAGEVGHITVATDGPRCACGNIGCLEIMASGTAIARRAQEAILNDEARGDMLRELAGGDIHSVTARHVFQAAELADPLANELCEHTAEYLAVGMGSIIHVLAPERIVLGGGVAQAGEFLFSRIRRRLHRHVFYVPLDRIGIHGAELGHDSALIGAGILALSPPEVQQH